MREEEPNKLCDKGERMKNISMSDGVYVPIRWQNRAEVYSLFQPIKWTSPKAIGREI